MATIVQISATTVQAGVTYTYVNVRFTLDVEVADPFAFIQEPTTTAAILAAAGLPADYVFDSASLQNRTGLTFTFVVRYAYPPTAPAVGPRGPGGVTGAAGPQGLPGFAGPQGPTGPAGLDGLLGPTGPAGPLGPTGMTGARGATGLQGVTGPTGPVGPTGPAGSVGAVDPAVVTTLATSGRPAQTDASVAGANRAVGTGSNLAAAWRRPLGVFSQAGVTGAAQLIQVTDAVAPAKLSVGSGLATAVGRDAAGAPVRVTDPTCVSGLMYLGYCDEAGVVTIDVHRPDKINVMAWGFDPSGLTPNDAQLAVLFTNINNTVWQQQTIYFPAGVYRFNSPWPSVPPGCWIEGDGEGSSSYPRFYTNAGTTLAFFGSGTAILFQSGGFATNSSHKGGVRNVCIVSGNGNGAASYPNIAECGIEIIGDATVTLSNIRVGGFKYNISVDGGEGIWMSEISFDANQFSLLTGADRETWTNYFGYADLNTDRDYVSFTGTAATVTFNAAARTIARTSGSWFTDGFKPGDKMVITGTVSNNGTWYPHNVTALTMTLVDTGLNPVTDEVGVAATITVTDQMDSACCVRAGEWRFQVGGSANGVWLDKAHFNSGRFGSWHKGGVGHYVSGGSYELGGGFAVVDGGNQLVFSDLAGEGYDVGPEVTTGVQVTYNAAARTMVRASGSWITDGFHDNRTIRSTGTVSNNQGMLRVQTVTALTMTLVPGSVLVDEVAPSPTIRGTGQGGIWIRAGGGPIGLTVEKSFFGRLNPAIKNDGYVYSLSFEKNSCYGSYPGANSGGTYPLDGLGSYIDLSGGTNVMPPDRPVLCRSYSGASSYGNQGTPINHQTLVQAALDVVAYQYGIPYLLMRAADHNHFEGGATAYNGGTNKWLRRLYSQDTGAIASVEGDVMERVRTAPAAGAATYGVVPCTHQTGGFIIATVTANTNDNDGKQAMFILRQAFHREDGGSVGLTLDGSLAVTTVDDRDGSMPVPTLATVGNGQALPYAGLVGVGVVLTGHATKYVTWTVKTEIHCAGR